MGGSSRTDVDLGITVPSAPPGKLAARAKPGSSIAGRYTVLEQLGAGGMGIVYRARDETTGAQVALKQLSLATSGSLQRKREALFEREYHTLVRLRHPRIIDVYDYGLAEAGPYYTMELLDGGDLQHPSPLPWREVCRHLCDVASSLALLHAHRLVHRDITPRNIRLTPSGRAKLIDFGALSEFGPATDVVGTPLCMAPEVLQRGTLDQRSDLYALGVVGYFALTGSHAFPVRSIDELPEAWMVGPVPPAQLRPEIPSALNALILSLVSRDRLSRPLHAAQVIDQLCAIAGLEVTDSELAADSYLASSRLVGRESEQRWVEARVERALGGSGAALVVSGAAGSGKTRLLREVGLDARMRGVLVLEADAEATSGYSGLAVALAIELLERGAALAHGAAQPDAGLLIQLAPALRERFDGVQPDPLPPNLAEQRARFQAALVDWVERVAQARPLLVLVDNLQAADETSAAFLATLGFETRNAPLVLVCSHRAGDEIRAPQPVSLLRSRSAERELERLDAEACGELVQSLFGDVVNSARVANLLYEKSAGNPQHCTELAQLLVRKGIAKYAAGTWVLPSMISSEELPDRLEDVFAVKLASLADDARALAGALCIHAKPIPLELCVSLAEGLSEAAAYAALAELVSQQILQCSDGKYQFVQQRLRVALLRGLSAARARALHAHAARVLERLEDLEARMQRGWHLLRAGDDRAGAELLASTSRAYLNTASAREDSQNVIDALRAALDVYERHGRSAHERAALMFPLILLCYYCPDHRLILQYAPKALRLGLEITGLAFAHKAQSRLGKERALRWALRLAGQRFAKEREQTGLQLTLPQAIGALSSIVPASIGSFGCHYDTPGAELIGELAEPLGLFPEDQLPALMYTWKQGQTYLVHGLEGDAHVSLTRALAQLGQPAIREVLGDAHWRSLRGGALMILGLISCYCGSLEALDIADEMATLGVRLWSMTADQVRLLHHAFRGESEQVQHYRERVERWAMQGGPTWHTELFWPAAMLTGDAMSGDTIAVRRTYQQLQRTSESVPTLRVHAACARAAYLSLRGDHAEAIASYERIVAELEPRRSVAWLPTRGLFARALNRAGQHARAKALLTETLAHVTDVDRGVRVLCFEVRRQLAIADAALGQLEQAARAIDAMLEEYAPDHNPMLLGFLHETRAQCSFASGDREAFAMHANAVTEYFRGTRNPALIAHIGQLEQLAATFEVDYDVAERQVPVAMRDHPGLTKSRASYTLAEISVAPDRHRYALELMIQESRAKGGCLYVLDGVKLQLVAASATHEPPQDLELSLLTQIKQSQVELDTLADPESNTQIIESLRVKSSRAPGMRSSARAQTQSAAPRPSRPSLFTESVPPVVRDENHSLVVLTARRAGRRIAVGGVILTLEPGVSSVLDSQLLLAVGEAMQAFDPHRV